MGQIGKTVLAFMAAVIAATALGSMLSSQFVMRALADIGTPMTTGDRTSMMLYDILNFGPLYGSFIFIGLAIAFIAGALVFKFAKTGRTFVYTVAGFIAMLVMLWAMKNVFFGVQLIAGARELPGLIVQAFAGSVAGFIFAKLSQPKIIPDAD